MMACRSRSTVANRSGKTLVTNAGCNGKFLAVVDFDVPARQARRDSVQAGAGVCEPSTARCRHGGADRQAAGPYASRLAEPLAITEGLLYRRGNFNGTFDQLILEALMAEKDAEIAFSPGFRWGTTLLPGDRSPTSACWSRRQSPIRRHRDMP